MTSDLFSALGFKRGPAMKNRMMLAPLTNQQSHDDGTPSEDDLRWNCQRKVSFNRPALAWDYDQEPVSLFQNIA